MAYSGMQIVIYLIIVNLVLCPLLSPKLLMLRSVPYSLFPFLTSKEKDFYFHFKRALQYPELYAHAPIRLRSALLLYGAPGTGKTMYVPEEKNNFGSCLILIFVNIKFPGWPVPSLLNVESTLLVSKFVTNFNNDFIKNIKYWPRLYS